jgi:sterol desaturase/sphingolipid hydroxylase (fatty acid hydroxylase superfamily)
MDTLINAFAEWQSALYEGVFQPIAFAIGLGNRLEDLYDASGWLLVALIQLVVMVLVFSPLQRWRPIEPVTDRRAIRLDVIYTLIHRLGLIRVFMFFAIEPTLDDCFGFLRVHGFPSLNLDDLWPGVTDWAVVSFVLYLILFDFVEYWIHRGQHHWNAWWALHAVHHSQRQMTQWTDSRNHLLDDVLTSTILVVVSQTFGIAPGQFVAVVALTQLSENLQHANVRLRFGRWGERLWVSPRFHRVHHAAGIGHESPSRVLGGHNFGVLLPWWDMLFGTADFVTHEVQTGIRDQIEQGRDYGEGFWAQHRLGLQRMWQAIRN